MSQLTIYLDAETRKEVTQAAKREDLSVSSWARLHLAKAARSKPGNAWDHLKQFVGTAEDDFEIPERTGEHRPIPDLEN